MAVHQDHEETNHKESISQMIMQFGQAGFFEFNRSTREELNLFFELDNNELKFVLGGLVDFM